MTTTNIGSRPVVVFKEGCERPFEVLRNDALIASSGWPCTAATQPALEPMLLKPGESRTIARVWHASPDGWAILLPVGTYSVRGLAATPGGLVPGRAVAVELIKR